jgi:hypothetical protein
VDVDFEPRWITKDSIGDVCVWGEKPHKGTAVWDGYYDTDYIINCFMYERLKLAEFENKPWQECIYEVPRKTTGKIEELEQKDGPFTWRLDDMFSKINELVDAVNEHADIIQQIGDWGTSKGECLWCEKLTSVNLEEQNV